MPNQDQLLSALRWVLTALGSFLTTNGTVSASTWQQVSGIILTLAPLVWSLFVHTQVQTALAAAAIPGVEPLRINRTAEPALQKLARDSSVPDIVEAPPVEYPPGIYGTARKRE
jgi:hypothetical protein